MTKLTVFAVTFMALCGLATAFVLEGSQTSYAQFKRWKPSLHNSTISFEYQTNQPNGILLYMDDGGYYDFLELKLVEGRVRLRYNFGAGPRVITLGAPANGDGRRWNKVTFVRDGTRTRLRVNEDERALADRESSLAEHARFGNVTRNSHVYVGGLPAWYAGRLSSLALPSVVFEPRYRGAIRNLVYADEGSPNGTPRRQEIIAYTVRPRLV